MKSYNDIHVVVGQESISGKLEATLTKEGFKEIQVAGGDPRAVMRRLFSTHMADKLSSKQLYQDLVKILSSDSRFRGYIEAETVVSDETIHANTSARPQTFTFGKLNPEIPKNTDHKEMDLHFTVLREEIDPELNSFLLDKTGFYFLDLHKHDGIYRVFTIQTRFARYGKEIIEEFNEKISAVGGFRMGYLKQEVTAGFQTFGGYTPPPILYNFGKGK